jgi:DNA-binding transcriptional LysR family regulator
MHSDRMIENSLLHILITFKKNGTLSKTAEVLNVSQPALSRSMQKLEEEINVPIFIHGKNSLKLNENGELLVQEAERLLNEQQKVIKKIQQFDQSNQNIRIGYSAPKLRAQYESIISKLYPSSNITWIMDSNEDTLLKQLNNSELDIIYIEKRSLDSSFYTKNCLLEHLKICVLPDNKFSTYKTVRFEDIDGETFLQNTSVGVWSELVTKYLPHSQIILQDNRNDLITLINNTPFSCFVTNHTDINIIKKYTNRIIIPIVDKEASKQFIFVTKNKKKFLNLIQETHN